MIEFLVRFLLILAGSVCAGFAAELGGSEYWAGLLAFYSAYTLLWLYRWDEL